MNRRNFLSKGTVIEGAEIYSEIEVNQIISIQELFITKQRSEDQFIGTLVCYYL